MSERRMYVGYLPALGSHAILARTVFVVLLLGAAVVGFVVAKTMNEPGEAVWDTAETTRITGTLRTDPVVFVDSDQGPVLLVELGKFGALPRAKELDGHTVEAAGSLLTRGSHRMIELLPGNEGLTSLQTAVSAPVSEQGTGRAVLAHGEILDAKCYLGAMKPGEGRSHKACATLCLRGGIPALFVGVSENGDEIRGVLVPGQDGVLDERWLVMVGEPVTLRGSLSGVHGLPVIEVLEVTRRRD